MEQSVVQNVYDHLQDLGIIKYSLISVGKFQTNKFQH